MRTCLHLFLIEHLNVKPFEHFQGGIGSPSKGISIEKQRANLNNYEIPPEILMENLRANLTNMGLRPTEADGVKETGHMATPGSGISNFYEYPNLHC